MAVNSEIGICNLALRHISSTDEIASLTEDSKPAKACNAFYETARDEVLAEWNWPFARKRATLNKVADDPETDYQFSYRYPPDCLEARIIPSGNRRETAETRIHYTLDSDSDGLLILTDQENAELIYTQRFTDPLRFPINFSTALSYLLASYIAPSLSNRDPFGMKNRMYSWYQLWIEKAQRAAANEPQPEPAPDSEFVNVR